MRVVAAVLAGPCCDANALSSACLVKVMGERMCLRKNVSEIFFFLPFFPGWFREGVVTMSGGRRGGERRGVRVIVMEKVMQKSPP